MNSTISSTTRLARALAVGVAIAGLSVGTVGVGTAGAAQDDDDRVIRTGSCSAGADWKLKVKTDDGRLEVEGEIDSNVAGQRWRWTLRHNGSVSDRGVATTTPRSGSFEVERKVVDLAGTDTLAFRAVRDGQVCRGVVNY
ncbi:hypothetical protein IEZ26_13485 [Nocardioides cavernae]|uniref:Secreted protein n=1 Tax=Nocardioides cavernae TaxID=1921566 RepID=A0ABR8NEJ0_9ACTN|nr:hypothetical protein [Nocardioides cavernae]MBD3925641.1 hypothetical protein [Nocardioides cavernae]MBM7513978.1 hypothetical protein [Nocardioides cavernae]